MGNPQHLEWLLEGVEAWNARRQYDYFKPDLSGFDIYSEFKQAGKLTKRGRIPLENINFSNADLRGANLSKADLQNANLRDADLGRYLGGNESVDNSAKRSTAVPDQSPGQLAALKAQIQVILAAPVQNTNTAETFAAQLDYATRAFRKVNNDVPDDLLLVEQVSDTFKQLAKAIPSADEDSLAKELANALAKIEELRATIEEQTAEIEALKKKGSGDWQQFKSAFLGSAGKTLGTGTMGAILVGGGAILGGYGTPTLEALKSVFENLLLNTPAPSTLPPAIGT